MKKSELKALTEEQATKIEKLESELASMTSTKVMYYEKSQISEKIVNEMHSTFDGISGCAERYIEQKQQYGGCATVELSISSRLASYMQTLIK